MKKLLFLLILFAGCGSDENDPAPIAIPMPNPNSEQTEKEKQLKLYPKTTPPSNLVGRKYIREDFSELDECESLQDCPNLGYIIFKDEAKLKIRSNYDDQTFAIDYFWSNNHLIITLYVDLYVLEYDKNTDTFSLINGFEKYQFLDKN